MNRRISRRGILGLAALGAGGATAIRAGALALPDWLRHGEPGTLLRSGRPLPTPYQMPLPIPPVLAPIRSDATTDYYEITQRTGDLAVFDGIRTTAWTYQGTFPGPTIVSRSGRRTVVRHVNRLPHPVVVHLHGGHTPHESDGYPTDLIIPVGSPPPHGSGTPMPSMPSMRTLAGATASGSRDYTYPMNQRAATLWYHDHRMGFTGASVWYGLAGFHLVHDDEEESLPLPKGDRDVPIMIADRSFDAAGQLHYPAVDPELASAPGVRTAYMNGVLGDVILVNGAPWPVMSVDRRTYRLRLLNASNARRYRLVLDPPPSGGAGLVQIGSDGGLLAAPITHDAIELAPAERFDIVIDFARFRPGTRVHLRNTLGSGSTGHVMRFDVSGSAGRTRDDAAIPASLATVATLDRHSAVMTRDFLFQNHGPRSWTINSRLYDPAHPLAYPRLGQTEVWRFVTDLHHPIHVHLNHFQVLARNGTAPGPYDLGWKDTLDLYPAQSAEIIVRFSEYAGRFLLHCHNLEHEDMAMMADFITR
jgi:FtsP/CotA-like multicopper oxidase with cupredoxin domain